MEITSLAHEGIHIFALKGRLDANGSEKAREAIIPHIPQGGRMALDMTECDYVASSGLRILMIAAKQSAAAGCKAVLCGLQPLVYDVIQMTGFENVLEVLPTRAAALAKLNPTEA